mmetsp:Transcript_76031/g.180944  ORF Transcript_76031/g.180944 Transcript_76031/m.180944 type:complete len:765 (+) Transcript_76031:130-2424(+)|eukprot:CAMPEP_0178446984 /NCGR_PEP_ID=MMETSP0689_2-20121128/41128_1 /TAXON_ID=160604 /ORGANISM="Amphidinium massartii, Strain CS-259" /LENGTH=764 /DNA_ID=CAMNT_0020071911 /DNA_START=54 /DNA_END=2348 /DNA_ORIENTATION=+
MARCRDVGEAVLLQVSTDVKVEQFPIDFKNTAISDFGKLVNDTAERFIDSLEGYFHSDKAPDVVNANTEGDLQAFLSALAIYALLSLGLFMVFSVLRLRFPIVFSQGVAPTKLVQELFAWVRPSLHTDTIEVANNAGLDIAMLMEFGELARRLMLQIGAPMLLVVAPMNCFFGGNAAGQDYLSLFSINNVADKSWLSWIHALSVVYIVEVTAREVIAAQQRFIKIRHAWLLGMDGLQATSVLVRAIPSEFCSDSDLKHFFEQAMPGSKVKSAYCVRDTSVLLQHIERYKALERLKSLTEDGIFLPSPTSARQRQRSGSGTLGEASSAVSRDLSAIPDALLAMRVETPSEYARQMREIHGKILEEQDRLSVMTEDDRASCHGNGFVTFEEPRCAEVAMQLQFSSSREEWIVSSPPLPSEVEWANLTWERPDMIRKRVIAYVLLATLFVLYLPVVMLITNVAEMIDLGFAQPIWKGIAPSVGLQVMVSVLPSLLLMIIRPFLLPVSETESQSHLAMWYFWFQLVFVVLSAPVGDSILPVLKMVTTDLLSFMRLLGTTLPSATHFYMNYMILKWFSHFCDLVRPSVLAKFLVYKRFYTNEREAKESAEPEDQNFHGIGARAARWSVVLTIGIVLSTVSPLICLLTWIDFQICHLCYGYLLFYAETKKSDQGGEIWVEQLRHIFVALGLYSLLMTGVLIEKGTPAAAVIAFAASCRLPWYGYRFEQLMWRNLPITTVQASPEAKERLVLNRRPASGLYAQPELTMDVT